MIVKNDIGTNRCMTLLSMFSRSPMEHYHLALLFKLLRKEHLNIFYLLGKSERMRVRKVSYT
jgi:hypothetical protein